MPQSSAVVGGFAAGLAAAVIVVGVSAATGAFDSTTTIVRSGPAAPAPAAIPVARTGGGGRFDPARLYRERSAGVVTVSSVLGGGERIGGSGFVVSGDGLVLTNAHVVTNSGDDGVSADDVETADAVYVQFTDGNQVPADVRGFDLFDDVALLEVSDPSVTLAPVPLGDSERVSVGEPVAAIGSPFSQAGSLSTGIVSAVDRAIPTFVTRYSIPGAIQTDAAINHGNSGGPLFNARGEVIGINAQINTTGGGGEGVGFAVPIDAAKRSLRQLERDGEVSYGWLGVRASSVTPALAREFDLPVEAGAMLETVSPGGPADQGGLRGGDDQRRFQDSTLSLGGDILVAVDGERVASSDDLVEVIAHYRGGARVAVAYVRDGRRAMATVTLGERPLAPSE